MKQSYKNICTKKIALLFGMYKISCTFVISNHNDMKTTPNYTNQLAVIMPRNNGTQAGINALAESLKRGAKK